MNIYFCVGVLEILKLTASFIQVQVEKKEHILKNKKKNIWKTTAFAPTAHSIYI